MTRSSTTPTLAELVGRAPRDEALRDARRRVTWGELESRTNAVGHGLEALGARPGDHLTLAAGNRAEFVEVLLGALRSGLVVTPVKTSWTADEVAYVVDDAGSVVVASDLDAGRGAAAATRRALLDLGGDFEDWLAGQPDAPLPRDRAGWRMSYTSGTTGRPRGVARTREPTVPFAESFPASARWAELLGLPPDAPHLAVSRLFHGAPLTFALAAMAAGAPMRILERWDPAAALDALGDGVGSSSWVPSQFRAVLGLPAEVRDRFDPSGLRTIVHGGEPCPPELKRRMIAWWGPILTEYYGCSEGGLTLCTSAEWLERPGTVGRSMIEGQRLRVLDDEGHDLPPGAVGRVFFDFGADRAFHYRNDPDKTEGVHVGTAFTAGDLGWLDEHGYLFITGRTSEVIVSGGVNVYPAEIEAALSDVEGIADLAVVAGPDELRGERPVACIELTEGAAPEAVRTAVETRAREALGREKQPRAVEIVEEVPRDPTGKLLRGELERRLWRDHPRFAAGRR